MGATEISNRLSMQHRRELVPPYSFDVNSDAHHFDGMDIREALIRETVQNSTDASRGGKVRMAYRRHVFPNPQELRALLGLTENDRQHWQQAKLTFPGESCDALLVEDFGTTGLSGSIDRDFDDVSNWAGFFYSQGASNKVSHGRSGGRFGIGKIALTLASHSSSVIVYTHTGATTRLMGIAQLPPRRIGEAVYRQTSWFADGVSEAGYSRPVEGEAADRLAEAFGLPRRTESGTSILILDPHSTLDGDDFADTIDTLAPIVLLRDIDVHVNGHLLDREALRKYGSSATVAATDLVDRAALVDPVSIGRDSSDLNAWLENNASLVASGVAFDITSQANPAYTAKVWMGRIPSEKDAFWTGARRSITTEAPHGGARPGWCVIFDAVSDDLSDFLSTTEGPSHKNWSPRHGVGSAASKDAAAALLKATATIIERLTASDSNNRSVDISWMSRMLGNAWRTGEDDDGFGTPIRTPKNPNSAKEGKTATRTPTIEPSMNPFGIIDIEVSADAGSEIFVDLLLYPSGEIPSFPIEVGEFSGCSASLVAGKGNRIRIEMLEDDGIVEILNWNRDFFAQTILVNDGDK